MKGKILIPMTGIKKLWRKVAEFKIKWREKRLSKRGAFLEEYVNTHNITGNLRNAILDLGSRNIVVRRTAAKALMDLEDPLAVQPLSMAVKDWDADVRFYAIEALENIAKNITHKSL